MLNNMLYLLNRAKFWSRNVNVWDLRMRACSLDRLVYLLFNKWGILGRQDRDLFSLIIKPGMNIVDVGANIGLLSMAFARLAGSDGHVFAFEPEPELFATLELNCRNNGFENISCFNMALGAKSGTSLLFQSDLHLGDNRMFGSEKSSRKKIEVPIARLDDIIKHQHIDFIKIDVQGYEMEVLKGMERLIGRSPNLRVMFEFYPKALLMAGTSPEELLGYFRNRDFQIFQLDQDQSLSLVEDISSIHGTKSLIDKHFLSLVAMRNP